ncbi:AbrB family transcriptional regulator [Planktotalea arctica]|uniref:AbrB family transcriptional regulator n=1 Tax=Planktotalea arctica TaxID=1481893 RepID=UPI001FEBBE4D|nr:AbrB family transcriptional regulator [Planktotalea arctica]
MHAKTLLKTAMFLILGSLGGWIMSHFPLPLPYMLGAMATSALAVAFLPRSFMAGYAVPEYVRMPFIACIGLLIGAQVHLELLTDWRPIAALLCVVTVFAPLAHFINYRMMRRYGGYDVPTAFFSAAPGGLIEAMSLGERAGAQIGLLTVQQFLRIILVVTLIPFAISLWVGHPVGSAAGMASLSQGEISPLWKIIAIGVLGYALGRALRIPAGQMTGPLILAGLLTATGWAELTLPAWLVILAQIVIGATLGLRFNGLSAAVLRRGVTLAIVSSIIMLALGAALALLIISLADVSGSAAWLSLAPGGVTEMALVALSLAADPALVTIAHVYRIALTVFIMSAGYARITRPPSPQA